MDVRFEWDPDKAASNLAKHGVSFELASLAFLDPYALSEQDRVVEGEERWQLIGSVQGRVLLLVAHTVRDERVEGLLVETFRIIRLDGQITESGGGMSSKLVRYTVDPAHPPALTEAQQAELDALAAKSEEEIDYGEIPPLSETFWANAKPGSLYKPRKASTTVRLDADVLAWLRAQGKGYQTRMNAILRREMLATLKAGNPR